ncbi:uncharacterized protein LOC144343134 [Saccoglossus kowalevskii]
MADNEVVVEETVPEPYWEGVSDNDEELDNEDDDDLDDTEVITSYDVSLLDDKSPTMAKVTSKDDVSALLPIRKIEPCYEGFIKLPFSEKEIDDDCITQVDDEDALKVAKELLLTEKKYVNKLFLLDQVFQSRIKTENKIKKWFPEDVVKDMFPYIKSIHQFHSEVFLPALKLRINDWKNNPKLGDLIYAFGPFFKMYTEYTRNTDQALEVLNTWMCKAQEFRNFIRDIEKQDACGKLPLSSHMLEPTQRICRYELLLKEYFKRLSHASKDKEDTEEALQLISLAAQSCNERKKDTEMLQKIRTLQSVIDGIDDLTGHNRILKKEGTLIRFKSRSGTQTQVFLFNDMLLCCKIRKTKAIKYKVIDRLQTRDNMKVNRFVENKFVVSTTDSMLTLEAESEDEMTSWVKTIQDVIWKYVKKKDSFQLMDKPKLFERDIFRKHSEADSDTNNEDMSSDTLESVTYSIDVTSQHTLANDSCVSSADPDERGSFMEHAGFHDNNDSSHGEGHVANGGDKFFEDDSTELASSTSTTNAIKLPFNADELVMHTEGIQDKAHQIALEILATEKKYVNRLFLIDQVFRSRITEENESKKWFSSSVIKDMFPNITPIYRFHFDVFFPALNDRMKNWNITPKIGDLFKTFGPFFKMYSEYVRNSDHAIKILNTWMEKESGFVEFVKKIQKDEACGMLPLANHMLEPIQRICRYEMLIKEYLKSLPRDSEDKFDSEDALVLISAATQNCNESKKYMEMSHSMRRLNSSIEGIDDLNVSRRILLKEAKLSKFKGKQSTPIQLFLFNDMILCCKIRKLKSIRYKVMDKLDFENELQVERFVNNKFNISSSATILTLGCISEDDMIQWVEDIQNAMDDFTKRRASSTVLQGINRSLTYVEADDREESVQHLIQSEDDVFIDMAEQPIQDGPGNDITCLPVIESPDVPASNTTHKSDTDEEDVVIQGIGDSEDTIVEDQSIKLPFSADELVETRGVQNNAHNVAQELLISERKYVNRLFLIDQVFHYRIENTNSSKKWFSGDDLKAIFPDIRSIYQFHREIFLPALENRLKEWNNTPKIGDVIKSFGPYFKIYSEYVRNSEQAIHLLKLNMSKSTEFSKFVHNIEKDEACGKLKLASHLLEPVQRICRYEILLKAIHLTFYTLCVAVPEYLKNLPDNSDDYIDTEQALFFISTAAQTCNESKRNLERTNELRKIQSSIEGISNLLEHNRVLLKEGRLMKFKGRGGTPVQAFMFNDFLLLCKIRKVKSPKYKVCEKLEIIDNMQVNRFVESRFVVSTKNSYITLEANSEEERDEWVNVIKEAIPEQEKKRLSFLTTNEMGFDVTKITDGRDNKESNNLAQAGMEQPIVVAQKPVLQITHVANEEDIHINSSSTNASSISSPILLEPESDNICRDNDDDDHENDDDDNDNDDDDDDDDDNDDDDDDDDDDDGDMTCSYDFSKEYDKPANDETSTAVYENVTLMDIKLLASQGDVRDFYTNDLNNAELFELDSEDDIPIGDSDDFDDDFSDASDDHSPPNNAKEFDRIEGKGVGCLPMIGTKPILLPFTPEELTMYMTGDKACIVANEILVTEKKYVNRLFLIDKIFRTTIEKRNSEKKWFPSHLINDMFPNIKPIYQFHSEVFEPALDARINEWTNNPRIADLIKEYCPYFKMYSEYVKNADHAVKLLNIWMNKVPSFARFVNSIERDPACDKLKLSHHMLEPVQRICRYELLLKEYAKTLSDDSEEKDDAIGMSNHLDVHCSRLIILSGI